MSFGWSVGDVAALAKLAYEIYRFCEAAPAGLQDLFDRFQTIAQKLEALQSILERAGLERWEAPADVERRLLNARDDLSPFQYVTDKDRSLGSRIKSLGHLAVSQEKLKRIDRDLSATDRALDDMKIDLIITCSLHTLQCVTQPSLIQPRHSLPVARNPAISSHGRRPTRAPILLAQHPHNVSNDSASVASDVYSGAQHAFNMARQVSRRRQRPSLSGARRPRRDQTQEFLAEITSIAESMELFDESVDLVANFDRLVEISETATCFETMSVYSDDTGSAVSMDNSEHQERQTQNSNSLERTDYLGSFSFERPSVRHRKSSGATSAQSRLSPTSVSARSYSDVLDRQTPGPLQPVSMHSSPDGEYTIQLLGQAKVTLTADINQAQDCFFVWENNESSVRLKVVSAGTEPSGFRVRRSHTSSKTLASFQHCLDQGARPIPHLLHPSVEGPKEEPNAPYTIAFTSPQYVSYDHAPQEPRWSTGLRYIFFNKDDRNQMCSRIFGKRIIMAIGCDLISCDGTDQSQMSALVLWEGRADDGGEISMTFSSNMTKTAPEDIEYGLLGLWDPSKPVKVKGGSSFITLAIEPMPASLDASLATLVDTTQRRPSTVSSTTTSSLFSRFSAESRRGASIQNRTHPEVNKKRIKCIVKLRESRSSAQFHDYLLRMSRRI